MNISVIIPAYNAGDTLAEALDSVLAQTCKGDEVIVIDDGSTDTTAAIAVAHPLAPKLISTANQGAAAALNLGISVARGDILTFLDADDLWHESKIELQSELLCNEPDISMVFSHTESFVCPSVSQEASTRLVFPAGPQPGYLLGTLMTYNNIFTRYGFFDPALKTGYFIDWFSQIKAEGVKYSMLKQVFMKRRVRPGTLSQRKSVAGDGLSSDFIEIARRAILRKRNLNDNTSQ